MTETDLEEGGRDALPWAGPEYAVIAILVVVGLVALGGLADGIYLAFNAFSPFVDPFTIAWSAVTLGASWAEPFLALFVLGAAGICWWQADRWADEVEAPSAMLEPARGYIQRAQRTSSWALWGLALTAVGSTAGLVATVGLVVLSGPAQTSYTSRLISEVASTLAVFVIAAIGWLVVRETRRTGVSEEE